MAEDNTLRLEVGKKYRDRKGDTVEIVRHDARDNTYFSSTGYWYRSTGGFVGFDCDPDRSEHLVEEIVETPAYRYFRFRHNTPGEYGSSLWRLDPATGVVQYHSRGQTEWYESICDERDLTEDGGLVECDADGEELGTELPDVEEVPAPTYRYFADPNDDLTDDLYVIWRSPVDNPDAIEARYLNLEHDPWEKSPDTLDDLTSFGCLECDESGKPLAQPEPGDTPDVEPRTRKLAARILLAGGPAFEWQDLSRMTVAELVAALPDHELNCFIQNV